MSLDSDVIVDRRRIRRKLTFWRVVAALGAIPAIVTIGALATTGARSARRTSGSIAPGKNAALRRSAQDRDGALARLAKTAAGAASVHSAHPAGGAGEGLLCVDSGPGEGAARHGRRVTRKSRGRSGVHRPSGGRSEADRPTRR